MENNHWSLNHWRATRDTQGGYILYHVGQEGQLGMSYQELCQLSEMLEQVIREHSPKAKRHQLPK